MEYPHRTNSEKTKESVNPTNATTNVKNTSPNGLKTTSCADREDTCEQIINWTEQFEQ